ncbi:hypothetical protein LI064_16590 [Clostridium perfringens]|uniref:hypothetical protein n=1 Tax=Clostridium perfringens TaxID=1502 RepID=UPI002247FA5A|nr:hypothetical protein [Clostridium perfringens]MCX0356129.1 hypothetical protein [Clostridium perfringens]MDM0612685.1 hypothetical protein [Clostridium perfringens]
MDRLFLITDNLFEILKPIVLIVVIITCIFTLIDLFLDRFEETSKNNIYDEAGGDEEDYTIQKAIITIGNEKIEIEVDDYDIEDTIIKIETKDEKLYLTDIKNVLLISE